MIEVKVFKGNVEGALKMLKRQLQKDGILGEIKRRSSFEKPSDKRRRKRVEAKRRLLKNKRDN